MHRCHELHCNTGFVVDQSRHRGFTSGASLKALIEQITLRCMVGLRCFDRQRQTGNGIRQCDAFKDRAHKTQPCGTIGSGSRTTHRTRHRIATHQREGQCHGPRRFTARLQFGADTLGESVGDKHQSFRITQLELKPFERRRW